MKYEHLLTPRVNGLRYTDITISPSAAKALGSLADQTRKFPHWPTLFYSLMMRAVGLAGKSQKLGTTKYTGVRFGGLGGAEFLFAGTYRSCYRYGSPFFHAAKITGSISGQPTWDKVIEIEPNNDGDFRQIPPTQMEEHPIKDLELLTIINAQQEQLGAKNVPLPQEFAAPLLLATHLPDTLPPFYFCDLERKRPFNRALMRAFECGYPGYIASMKALNAALENARQIRDAHDEPAQE